METEITLITEIESGEQIVKNDIQVNVDFMDLLLCNS